MILAYRVGDRAVFLYGFAKNERDNIGPDQVLKWREAAARMLATSPDRIAEAIEDEGLEEIDYGEESSC